MPKREAPPNTSSGPARARLGSGTSRGAPPTTCSGAAGQETSSSRESFGALLRNRTAQAKQILSAAISRPGSRLSVRGRGRSSGSQRLSTLPGIASEGGEHVDPLPAWLARDGPLEIPSIPREVFQRNHPAPPLRQTLLFSNKPMKGSRFEPLRDKDAATEGLHALHELCSEPLRAPPSVVALRSSCEH